MEFDAILEKRLMHWYVYVPSLADGCPVPERTGAEAAAAALITAATGLHLTDLHVSLHVADGNNTIVQNSPTDVDIRHHDGNWCSAEHLGWLRTWDGAWKALVSYSAEGALWERAVHASCFRQPDQRVPAGAAARTSVVHTVADGGGSLRP